MRLLSVFRVALREQLRSPWDLILPEEGTAEIEHHIDCFPPV